MYQEKYKVSLLVQTGESELDKSFRLGMNFAYYDCLDILESQLKAFQVNTSDLGGITPTLGGDNQQ